MRSDLAHEQAEDRSAWSSLLRERFVALEVGDAARDDVHGDVDSWSLGHLQVSRVRSVSQAIERSPALVRSDDRDYLQVGLIREGAALTRQDGREAVLGVGDFVLYETTRPFDWVLRCGEQDPLWTMDVFTWPRESLALSQAHSRLATARTMRGDAGLSAVISRMLASLVAERPALEPPRAASLADEVGDLLAVLACGVVPMESHRRDAALLASVERYIDDHLHDPGLGPDEVARAHSVSTRQLHRLFADRQQTVARTIRTRRLERCRRELVSPAGAGRAVAEIGRRWGFVDAGSFGRAFREAYGVSPTQYRDGAGWRRTT